MTPQILTALAIAAACLGTAAGFLFGKKGSTVASPDVKTWVGGAIAAFMDGFIDGLPIGAPTGAGIAAADGKTYADLQAGHLALEAAHLLAIPVLTALADVRAYKKANAFPNIFATKLGSPPIP